MVRKQQSIQFEQNDKLFKALIENSWDVIVLIDKKAHVKYASPSVVRMFGRDYNEFINTNGLKFLHPEDLLRVTKGLAQIILHPRKKIHMELRVKHKLGHYLWVEALATNFLSDKNINGIVVNYHNITELKNVEERKDEFISIASHELKTPITTLKVYMQLLNNNIKTISPSKTKEYLTKMNNQIYRIERFVTDLYDASRIREGKLSLSKERFTLLKLLHETADDISKNYNTHKIYLNVLYKGSVIADKTRIQQVLFNILINAIKFSPNANKIKIKVWEKEKNIYISITDYGLGITKENLIKITERFYQADSSNRSTTGLGLGLYIAYNIIKQHNGDFYVKSHIGKSTTVTFFIPKK